MPVVQWWIVPGSWNLGGNNVKMLLCWKHSTYIFIGYHHNAYYSFPEQENKLSFGSLAGFVSKIDCQFTIVISQMICSAQSSAVTQSLSQDPSVHEALRRTYDRLKERHRKLQALRHGLDIGGLDTTDAASLRSEITDFGERKSMISANSFTQGLLFSS